jgi:hypothetical protein
MVNVARLSDNTVASDYRAHNVAFGAPLGPCCVLAKKYSSALVEPYSRRVSAAQVPFIFAEFRPDKAGSLRRSAVTAYYCGGVSCG